MLAVSSRITFSSSRDFRNWSKKLICQLCSIYALQLSWVRHCITFLCTKFTSIRCL
jgi:hypothetical protein